MSLAGISVLGASMLTTMDIIRHNAKTIISFRLIVGQELLGITLQISFDLVVAPTASKFQNKIWIGSIV